MRWFHLLAGLAAFLAAGCGEGPESPIGLAHQGVVADQWKVVFGNDFNLDGMADVLWNNAARNEMAVWLMRGDHLLTPGPSIPGPVGEGWVAVTATDFDGDGMADVLWNNTDTPEIAIWLMAGDQLLSPGPILPGPAGNGWNAVEADDFDGGGFSDVLWQNASTNQMAIWLMAGPEVLVKGPALPAPPGTGWVVANTSDFNQDGLADILWYNTETNRMSIWLLSGTDVLEAGPEIDGPQGGGWIAISSADFDFDGMTDVLWGNATTNRIEVWSMAGTSVLAVGPEIPGPAGSGWTAATAADYDLDGMADVVFQNLDADAMAVWLMQGLSVARSGPAIPGPGR